MREKIQIVAILAVLILAMATVANAECTGTCGGGWGGGYYGYLPNYSTYVRDYIPPYFALYPPVYYSLPVPRTYGYSPYAYPPGTMTPDLPEPQPVIVPNKFVPSKFRPKADSGQVTQRPLRIANPYVLAGRASAAAGDVAAAR